MKTSVSMYDFGDAFRKMGRGDNFSYKGLQALYEYLTDLEDDIGKEFELDVIALYGDYNEYEDLMEFLGDYGNLSYPYPDEYPKNAEYNGVIRSDYDDDEDFEEAVKEEIRDNTTFIDVDGESFIIGAY